MELEKLKEAVRQGRKICLGHACIGAYSCFEVATEALDSQGNGYCAEHASYIKEAMPNTMICPICNRMVECSQEEGTMFRLDGKAFKWECQDPDCPRCGGTGIDPVCKK